MLDDWETNTAETISAIAPASFTVIQRGRAGGPLIGGGFGRVSPGSPLRNT